MSLGDILLRVGTISSRYEKYMPVEKELGKVGIEKGSDFETAYQKVEYEVRRLEQKAIEAREEKNRATVAVLNNEVRKAKNQLLKEIPDLSRVASKCFKGQSPEDKKIAEDRIHAIEERLQAVGDGFSTRRNTSSSSRKDVQLSGNMEESLDSNPLSMESTEESRAFRQEFEMAKLRQDEALTEISSGLTTLKSVANDMSEEMKVQNQLMDEIEDKVDNANLELKTQNSKLKELVHSVRSSGSFCVDVILVIILLGIGAYIYNVSR